MGGCWSRGSEDRTESLRMSVFWRPAIWKENGGLNSRAFHVECRPLKLWEGLGFVYFPRKELLNLKILAAPSSSSIAPL